MFLKSRNICNIIKIKYINNIIKDTEWNIFIPTQEIHDNVEITVE